MQLWPSARKYPDLFSRQGAGWDTVDSGSEEQAYVFSPATLSTLVRLHDTSGQQSLSGRACCGYGCRATATALPVVFVTVLLPTGSGSARSDTLCALTTNHPYGPSLVVGSYLVWDATRRELWETALLSTTRRLPVREYWTQ